MVSVESVLDLGRSSSGGGGFDAFEATEMLCFSVNSDLSNPAIVLRVPMHSSYARLVIPVPLCISAVFWMRNVSEIVYSVVAWIAVDMVNDARWMVSMMVEPSKSMCLPVPSEHVNGYIPIPFVRGSHFLASFPSSKSSPELVPAIIGFPREQAGFGVIMYVIFELLLSDHLGTFSQRQSE